MLLKWINYCRGTVRLQVTGAYPERFLNLCMRQGIALWDLEREGEQTLLVSTHVSSFRAMRDIRRKCGCHMHLVRRGGLPFRLHRWLARPVLLLGAGLFALAIYFTGSRVWAIDIVGAEELPRYELMEQLADLGVAIGVDTDSIEPRQVKNAMLSLRDDLAFVAVNIRGNQVQVELQSRVLPPQMEEESPATIVSDKTGVIATMDVKQGQAVKAVGQSVTAGETLVDSLMVGQSEGAQPRLVHASADITLRTWYTYERVLPLPLQQKTYTGRTSTRYALIVGEKRINLFTNSGNLNGSCDKIATTTELRLSDSLVVPLALVREERREYTLSPAAVDQQQLQELLVEQGRQELQARIGQGEIVSYQTNVVFYEDRAVLSVWAECLEPAGVTVPDERNIEELIPEGTEKES